MTSIEIRCQEEPLKEGIIEISLFGDAAGSSLNASSLFQPAGVFASGFGLGMGMGPLHAQVLMNMGLMAGVPNGNGPQFQGLQLGISSMQLRSFEMMLSTDTFLITSAVCGAADKNAHLQTVTGCGLEHYCI